MIDRPKSLGEAWRLLIQMETKIEGMYESHSLKCTQYEDRVSELETRNAHLESWKADAEGYLVEYGKFVAEVSDPLKKRAELQAVVDRLADRDPLATDVYFMGSLQEAIAEVNARIEYAAKHASQQDII